MRTTQIEAILFRKEADAVRYLLFKRNAQKGGFWQPVTGGVEEGESIEDCLKRELSEETGFHDPKNIIDLRFHFSFPDDHGGVLTEYVYGVELAADQEPKLSSEHTEYRWVDLDEAMQLLKWEDNKVALGKLNDIVAENSPNML
jgi:8-oxo-dGTP pyrophosphatase MutT (NUDIX family)